MSEWSAQVELGALLTLQRGFDLPVKKREDGDVPVIASTGQVGRHNEAKVRPPGVVIGRSGSLGGGQYISQPFWPLNTTLWVKDFKGNCPRFCYYLLRSLNLERLNAGTTVPTLNRNHAHRILISRPPVREQRAIAGVLGALDDKVELNREMNRTLEATAQAIFRSWFVDFDPVVAKADGRRPFGMTDDLAALFPDRFVESELGPIPEGWKPTKVGNVMRIRDSERIPLSRREREKRPGEYPYYGAAGVVDHIDDFIFDGVFLLLGEDGSVIEDSGKPVTQYVWGKIWVNNHAHVIVGKGSVSTEMLACFFRGTDIAPYVTGAVQPKLNQRNLKSVPFLLPPADICQRFDTVTQPIVSRLRAASDESQTLASLRDLLLPKLLSGEIRVAETEAELEAAGG